LSRRPPNRNAPYVPMRGTNLVCTRSIPGFSDYLRVRQHVGQLDSPDYGRIGQQLTRLASCEDGSFIEAEPINMHIPDPEFQAFDDQFFGDRVVTVNRVTAAGVIYIVLFV